MYGISYATQNLNMWTMSHDFSILTLNKFGDGQHWKGALEYKLSCLVCTAYFTLMNGLFLVHYGQYNVLNIFTSIYFTSHYN